MIEITKAEINPIKPAIRKKPEEELQELKNLRSNISIEYKALIDDADVISLSLFEKIAYIARQGSAYIRAIIFLCDVYILFTTTKGNTMSASTAKSPKTTWGAVIAAIIAILQVVIALIDGDISSINWEITLLALATAWGFLMARDNDKSSEDVGAK